MRGQELMQESGSRNWSRHCGGSPPTAVLSMDCSAIFHTQSRNIGPRMALPTVGWNLPHQLAIKKLTMLVCLFECHHSENVLPKSEAHSFHGRCSISGSLTTAKLKFSTDICQQINWLTITCEGNQEYITQRILATWNKLSNICQYLIINFLIEDDKLSKWSIKHDFIFKK